MSNRSHSVSAIIPVYNGERTIARAIDSALAQKLDGTLEVIVVNDGSTDATAAILERYEGRITVLTQANRGVAAARNAGVRRAHGDYLAFLDADDQWMPEKLGLQLAAFADTESAVMVYCDANQINGLGESLAQAYTRPHQRHAPSHKELLAEPWNILPSTIVVTRQAFESVGGFDEGFTAALFEDPWFFLMIRERGPFIYLDRPLVNYLRSTSAEHVSKHLHEPGPAASAVERLQANLENYDTMLGLLNARYGRAARAYIRAIKLRRVNFLAGLGLSRMADGDPVGAREWYRCALKYAPLHIKTWLRIGWTLVPRRVARTLAERLPVSITRSLAGPPYGG